MESKNWEYKSKDEYEKFYGVKDEDKRYYTTITSPLHAHAEIEYAKAKKAWEEEISRMKPGAIWTMPLMEETIAVPKTVEGWTTVLCGLEKKDRDNLMYALLIYLGENK